MHTEVLPPSSAKTLPVLTKIPALGQFYLAGGTGLALQLGHRVSADFDFFSQKKFNENVLLEALSKTKNFSLEKRDEQTIIGVLQNTKVAFFYYPYPLLKGVSEYKGLKIASVLDIACMKTDAISSRGTKRDFIDLYAASKKIPLKEILIQFQTKYSSLNYNMMHVKKSLVYFDDAEHEPMPKMLYDTSWKAIKNFFKKEI